MSTLSISIPESLRQRVEALADEDGVAVESFIATVLSQRVAVADADSYVRLRGRRGNAKLMLEILTQAPRVQPAQNDKLPEK